MLTRSRKLCGRDSQPPTTCHVGKGTTHEEIQQHDDRDDVDVNFPDDPVLCFMVDVQELLNLMRYPFYDHGFLIGRTPRVRLIGARLHLS